ncbi:hypothetical protein, variant [Verruconis gallopava]|uniref:DUF2235 domain-containing protein n=1 Tax=Verruconis gallopava TaxID=253628 RepID=A0A0D1YDU8_9PEZI|nr:uncharacterized protein PV09_09352 [Verruconis gallopava]XP_016208777.1 hypothetical protein, variant [Verruconis gallopava]KIV98906.1 hypothetical protein PV09_09352 [Verruconis gallopava]KIV98907.1 hypothetical protein, variant [Verruconis gallopava]
MTDKPLNRLIICVDGAEYDENGKLSGLGSSSNVFKLKSIIASGTHQGTLRGGFNQIIRYYQAVGDGRFGKFKTRSVGSIDQQIKDITRDICEKLESPDDEIFFYGFGRGAYIVRAVAALLHFMGVPKSMSTFATVYQYALDLENAHSRDDSLNGNRLLTQIRELSNAAPVIRFVGLFDTVRPSLEKHQYDISFVGSIQNIRHALAFNETGLAPEVLSLPSAEAMKGRSFVQAWFMGSHRDMGGGGERDGLSLYPYQWMILESINSGLVIQPDSKDRVLELAFPQFTGSLPNLGGEEKIEWRLRYANGLETTLFDLQSLHTDTKSDPSHSVRLAQNSRLFHSQRKIWNNSTKELHGWTTDGAWGTIIHPSLFVILDRNPKMYEQGLFKLRKLELADFQERCFDDERRVQPWLEGLHLQASGVKAFRILVCGKTGVGKSTLINKVFGVEMTEESNDYSQGVHDIDKAFESPNHPGLLIHDSRGWQAGSDHELDLIAKFLRHRAFQKDPAESLHVIWFCVDSDVSRIEEADKRTFQTIAQFSHHVPVFVVGTKKDKLVAFRKMQLLEEYMKDTNDFKEASKRANLEADKLAEEQFGKLRDQFSQIEHYKADGYCCISKDDDDGIRALLNQTLDLITDERVRLFCVAAQVMDVEQKIDSAITECMRLGTHAIRTAMVPLPFSGMIGTPTVSRIICEHILQCFGFPKAAPEEIEDIMSRVVMGNLKNFMKVTLSQFGVVSLTAVGTAVPTLGIGIVVGAIGCILASPPTARMLFKCACDMILILERSFRYQGKYVSIKQIEDAAVYYTTAKTKTFSGKEVLLQQHVHDEVDRLIPLKKVSVGFGFGKLRGGLQDIIYMNRFDKKSDGLRSPRSAVEMDASVVPELDPNTTAAELDAGETVTELSGDNAMLPAELDTPLSELKISSSSGTQFSRPTLSASDSKSSLGGKDKGSPAWTAAELEDSSSENKRTRSDGGLFKRSLTKFSLKKSKTKS